MAKILIIEDNEQNSYLITFLLEKAGHKVQSASDGARGIAIAESDPPDLILLDIRLPGMDGLRVLSELRKRPILSRIPIVAVTSHAMAGDREKILAAGCNGYIEKPIDPDTFLDTVTSFLPHAQKQNHNEEKGP